MGHGGWCATVSEWSFVCLEYREGRTPVLLLCAGRVIACVGRAPWHAGGLATRGAPCKSTMRRWVAGSCTRTCGPPCLVLRTFLFFFFWPSRRGSSGFFRFRRRVYVLFLCTGWAFVWLSFSLFRPFLDSMSAVRTPAAHLPRKLGDVAAVRMCLQSASQSRSMAAPSPHPLYSSPSPQTRGKIETRATTLARTCYRKTE